MTALAVDVRKAGYYVSCRRVERTRFRLWHFPQYSYLCGMKALSAYRPALFLLAALVLLSAASCSDRSARIVTALSAADSLMLTDPRAALDILNRLDSTVIRKMGSRDKAFYTLLRTEAKYKCWLPVAEDTAIFEAVKYYKKRGSKSMYARALMISGAALQEIGRPVMALEAYKNVEPLLEVSGEYEQTGLLHTRVGELYQSTFVDTDHAVERYRRAIECFEKGQVSRRLAPAYLTLARVLLPYRDSVLSWNDAYIKGMEYARETDNLSCIIEGMNQKARYLQLIEKDYSGAKRVSLRVLRNYSVNNSYNYYSDFLSIISNSYAELNMLDSAKIYADRIPVEDAVSRMVKYKLYADIAEKSKDWKLSNQYFKRFYAIKDNLKNEGDTSFLSEREYNIELRNLQLLHDNERYRLKTIIYMSVAFIAIAGIFVAIIIFRLREIRTQARRTLSKMSAVGMTIPDTDMNTQMDVDILFRYIDKIIERQGSNESFLAWIKEHILLLNKILGSYYVYNGNNSLSNSLSRLFDECFEKKNARRMMAETVEILYPGFLDHLRNRYTKLTDTDLYYISMMICGFSSNAQQVLTGNKIETIYVARSKAGAKMGSNITLSKILINELHEYLNFTN